MGDTALEDQDVTGDEGELGQPDTAALGARIREQVEAEAAEAEAGDVDNVAPAVDGGDDGQTADVEDSPALVVCPFCAQGFVDPTEALDLLKRVVANLEPFEHSPRFATCDECDGWGAILTGSRMPGAAVQPCPKCEGAGYVAASPIAGGPPEGSGEGAPADAAAALPSGDPLSVPPERGGSGAPGMEWNPQKGRWDYPDRPAND